MFTDSPSWSRYLLVVPLTLILGCVISWTSTREAHVEMPVIPANLVKPDAPLVYLKPATDSRPSDVIARYDEVWLASKYTYSYVGPRFDVTTGGELAEYMNGLMVGYLGIKGFRAKPLAATESPIEPAPRVHLRLVTAQGPVSEGSQVSPVPSSATADIEVDVTDTSGHEIFSNSYSAIAKGFAPNLLVPFQKTVIGADELWLKIVNQAVEETIKKIVADPAFIAALRTQKPAEANNR